MIHVPSLTLVAGIIIMCIAIGEKVGSSNLLRSSSHGATIAIAEQDR
jgi:hypothetical protein